ncbi:MAG: phoA [Mucilaginibacter sp.]|nr:phoA [Mucilaginibacter sp.]
MSFQQRNPRVRPVFKRGAIDDQEKFKPLPSPTGIYPYHLDLEQTLPGTSHHKLVFHMTGDTGSLRVPDFQRAVAKEMTKQYDEAATEADRPQFMFHLGDVVYNFGQEERYYDQFFFPYQHYPAPVFAIPGNHDGDVDPLDPRHPESLAAFRKVFCDTESRPLAFAGDTGRKSNIQPNVYWTLKTPLAYIIGVYSNVPKFGTIADEQKAWFINELKTAAAHRNEKAIILCLHHAPYSADINHGSSLNMQLFLNEAFDEAGVRPDIVFSGHVHNYQRFYKTYSDGQVVPFIVSGAGGYADLHPIADPGDTAFPDDNNLLDNIGLQNYCDDSHGFLKITLTKDDKDFKLDGQYYTVPDTMTDNEGAVLFDSFTVDFKKKLS